MTCTRIFEAGWRTALLRVVLVAVSLVTAPAQPRTSWSPVIPRTWDEAALKD